MRFQSYFNTATALLRQYDGTIPLTHFLKTYFSQHKKHGSKDRKFITHLCYCFYRLGNTLKNLSVEEKLKTAIFICNAQPQEWNILYNELWLKNWNEDLVNRIDFVKNIYPDFTTEDIFSWKDEISEGIDFTKFSLSHFIQPDLFLRIRPGKEKVVKQKLAENNISFREISASCLSLSNSTKVDDILKMDEEVVIQDYSSQRIGEFLQLFPTSDPRFSTPEVWDCCAASGGKSILAKDILGKINLTVSDVRPSILHNLEKRFADAEIKNYKLFVEDLSTVNSLQSIVRSKTTDYRLLTTDYNIIICDVPCSGSGTWSRTPEQLAFFNKEKINEYSALQKKIISNSIQHLKQGGYFLYITCSVFKKENEENVAFIRQQFGLQIIKQELLIGYETKADTMFAALMTASPNPCLPGSKEGD